MVPPCSELLGSLCSSKCSPAALVSPWYQSSTGLRSSGPLQGEAASGHQRMSDPPGMPCPIQHSHGFSAWLCSQAAVRSSSLYPTRGTGFTPTSGPYLAELSPMKAICSSIIWEGGKAKAAPFWGKPIKADAGCLLQHFAPSWWYSLLLTVTPTGQCSILHTTQNILGLGETGLLFPVQLEMTGYQIAHKWSCYWFVELQRRWRSRKSSIPHGPWVTTAVWLELSEACRNLISKSKPLGSLSPSPLQSINCSKIAHHIQNCTVLHCNCSSLRVISIMKPASLRVLCCYGFAPLQ